LGFGCLDIRGFYDREIDELLGVDGLSYSTIYMGAIGRAISQEKHFTVAVIDVQKC